LTATHSPTSASALSEVATELVVEVAAASSSESSEPHPAAARISTTSKGESGGRWRMEARFERPSHPAVGIVKSAAATYQAALRPTARRRRSPDPWPAKRRDNLADCLLSNGVRGGVRDRCGFNARARGVPRGRDRDGMASRGQDGDLAPQLHLDRNLDASDQLAGWLRASCASCDEGARRRWEWRGLLAGQLALGRAARRARGSATDGKVCVPEHRGPAQESRPRWRWSQCRSPTRRR
jgi:hypothetical protein